MSGMVLVTLLCCRLLCVNFHFMFLFSDLMEEILSPDEDSCNSSHMSNKSEKNMADFEGEDGLSDADLARINPTTPQAYQHCHSKHIQTFSDIFYQTPTKQQGT